MTTPFDTIKNAVLGIPFDANKEPSRQGVVQAFAEMQKQLEGAQAGALVKDTLSNLQALSTVSETSMMAWVLNDTVKSNNGIYENTGTANSPSWTRRADIPQFLITGINSGGTANAIQATTDLPIPSEDGRCLIVVPVTTVNTGSVTVSFNGGSNLTIKKNSNVNLVAGDIVPNMNLLGVVQGSSFRLVSDIYYMVSK